MPAVGAQARDLHLAAIGLFQRVLLSGNPGVADRVGLADIHFWHGLLLSSGYFSIFGNHIDEGVRILQVVLLQQAELFEADGQGLSGHAHMGGHLTKTGILPGGKHPV